MKTNEMSVNSEYLNLLKDKINLHQIPFSERGSRLLIFKSGDSFTFRLAERWFKREGQLSAYHKRPPLIDQCIFTDEKGNPLELQITTYSHRIDVQTRRGMFSLVFALDLIISRDDIYEYYHPMSGENPPTVASMFGWSSAVFIELAIQATREKMQ